MYFLKPRFPIHEFCAANSLNKSVFGVEASPRHLETPSASFLPVKANADVKSFKWIRHLHFLGKTWNDQILNSGFTLLAEWYVFLAGFCILLHRIS
jgi:hypothetical protein